MPIVFVRVDDRLIHGQVVQAWLPQLNVDEVVIPCTKKNKGTFNQGLLRLSLPYEYDLSFMEVEKIASYAATSSKRLFLLMSSLEELSEVITNGVSVRSVNIGGLHFKDNAQKFADHVFLDAKDKKLLKLARDLGIEIETRAVPNGPSLSISEVFDEP